MIYGYALLTLITFYLGFRLSRKLKSSIFNPFLITLTLLIVILVAGNVSYSDYYQGNFPLNSLINLSVVALAIPLYEQLPQIRQQWREILLITVFGTFFAIFSGMLLALILGGNQEIIASIAGKSVTMPIALAISDELSGNATLSAMGVVIAGLLGSVFGLLIMKLGKIKNPQAIGLAMGIVSHALGTARVMEQNSETGSYSSMALVLCGIFSALCAPIAFRLTLALYL